MKILNLVIACIVLSLMTWKKEPLPQCTSCPIVVDTCASANMSESIETFGFDIFQAIVASGETNVLISPLSLSIPFYMLMNAAEGNTLVEMLDVFTQGNVEENEINCMYLDLINSMILDTEPQELSCHNVVFYDDSRIILNEKVQDTIANYYDANYESLDFTSTEALEHINAWAAEVTENRIPEILKKIESEELMFLINALTFTADWKEGFDSDLTENSTFTLEDGSTAEMPFMQSDALRTVYMDAEVNLIDMAFRGDQYSMSFIQAHQGIDQFISNFDGVGFNAWYENALQLLQEDQRILLEMPKFEMKFHMLLNELLKSLGLIDAFDDNRAMLELLGQSAGNKYISRVIHDTYLSIDEKGAEGAAVTVVAIADESAPPVIRFDQPFLYIIRNAENNTPIFIGKFDNPQ